MRHRIVKFFFIAAISGLVMNLGGVALAGTFRSDLPKSEFFGGVFVIGTIIMCVSSAAAVFGLLWTSKPSIWARCLAPLAGVATGAVLWFFGIHWPSVFTRAGP